MMLYRMLHAHSLGMSMKFTRWRLELVMCCLPPWMWRSGLIMHLWKRRLHRLMRAYYLLLLMYYSSMMLIVLESFALLVSKMLAIHLCEWCLLRLHELLYAHGVLLHHSSVMLVVSNSLSSSMLAVQLCERCLARLHELLLCVHGLLVLVLMHRSSLILVVSKSLSLMVSKILTVHLSRRCLLRFHESLWVHGRLMMHLVSVLLAVLNILILLTSSSPHCVFWGVRGTSETFSIFHIISFSSRLGVYTFGIW